MMPAFLMCLLSFAGPESHVLSWDDGMPCSGNGYVTKQVK